MLEKSISLIKKGKIKIFREDNGEVLYCADNIITNVSTWLFSIFMAATNPEELLSPPQQGPLSLAAVAPPAYGVWGLALGSGNPLWGGTPPTETAEQTELFQEITRVQLSRVNFDTQDTNGNWNPQQTLTQNVEFQTTVNSTINNIQQPIEEMGLIGGGIANMAPYTMLTAPYFNGNPSSYSTILAAQRTVILINYKTLPALALPPGINIIFSWILQF